MRVLFDTSGVNRLLGDPDAEFLLRGIEAVGQVWVSAMNVAEASATADSMKRTRLLRLLLKMSAGRRPLEMPTALVRRVLISHARSDPDVVYSVEGGNGIAWQVMNAPDELTGEVQREMLTALRSEQDKFVGENKSVRPEFQEVLRSGNWYPASASQALRAHCANEQIFDFVAQLYRQETGKTMLRSEVRSLLLAAPELKAHLLARAYGLYRQAVAPNNHGKNNAGIVDLWFATYLPRVTWFITNDRKQLQALRLVSCFFESRCHVMSYEHFRRKLLLDP